MIKPVEPVWDAGKLGFCRWETSPGAKGFNAEARRRKKTGIILRIGYPRHCVVAPLRFDTNFTRLSSRLAIGKRRSLHTGP